MGLYLGIDTSNYTTSVAVYDSFSHQVVQSKRLLPVKSGELGLRQSDALFHHTVALPELVEEVLSKIEHKKIDAVAVSNRPRNVNGSYMPCFLAGVSVARGIAAALGVSCYYFSHQEGHIAAAMYSADRMDLLSKEFVAFHLSGGTTEALLVKRHTGEHIFDAEIIAKSLDLKAGQSVDRTGVMLGLDFPAGMALDALAQKSDKEYKIKPFMRGCDCSFSGLENKTRELFNKGEKKEDIEPADVSLWPNLTIRDRREEKTDLWAMAEEDSFRGLYLRKLQALAGEDPRAALAAEISHRILLGREVPLP